MISVKAILPKKVWQANAGETHINLALRDFAFEFQRVMATYPPAKPWKNPPPKTGPRRGGRRTGNYGRGWTSPPKFSRDRVVMENNVSYSAWVGGSKKTNPGQARALAARGWISQDDAIKDVRKRVPLPPWSRVM